MLNKMKLDAWGDQWWSMREKERLRERMKKRRQRAQQAMRPKEPAPVIYVRTRTYDVFQTQSGALAVKAKIVNRSFGHSASISGTAAYYNVTLPHLTFLHGPVPAALSTTHNPEEM